jgi:hypothetical protein
LQMSQPLLQWYAANLVEKLQVFLLLSGRQHPRCFAVANPFLLLVPSLSATVQGFVIDQPNATQCAAQELFLFLGWVKAVSVGTLSHALHFATYCVRISSMCLEILGTLSPRKFPPFPLTVKSMRGTRLMPRCVRADYNGSLHGGRR